MESHFLMGKFNILLSIKNKPREKMSKSEREVKKEKFTLFHLKYMKVHFPCNLLYITQLHQLLPFIVVNVNDEADGSTS